MHLINHSVSPDQSHDIDLSSLVSPADILLYFQLELLSPLSDDGQLLPSLHPVLGDLDASVLYILGPTLDSFSHLEDS